MTITEIARKAETIRKGNSYKFAAEIYGTHFSTSFEMLDDRHPVALQYTGEIIGGIRNKKEFCELIKSYIDARYEEGLNAQ